MLFSITFGPKLGGMAMDEDPLSLSTPMRVLTISLWVQVITISEFFVVLGNSGANSGDQLSYRLARVLAVIALTACLSYYGTLYYLVRWLGRSSILWVGGAFITYPIGPVVAYFRMRALVRSVVASIGESASRLDDTSNLGLMLSGAHLDAKAPSQTAPHTATAASRPTYREILKYAEPAWTGVLKRATQHDRDALLDYLATEVGIGAITDKGVRFVAPLLKAKMDQIASDALYRELSLPPTRKELRARRLRRLGISGTPKEGYVYIHTAAIWCAIGLALCLAWAFRIQVLTSTMRLGGGGTIVMNRWTGTVYVVTNRHIWPVAGGL